MASFIQESDANDIFKQDAYCGIIGFVAHPNGLIYGIPCRASRVVEYNTATNTTRLVGDDFGDDYDKWHGGTLGSDNCIYCCPLDADRILKYDPSTETSTLVGDPVEGDYKYTSAISVPQTNTIFFIPYNAERDFISASADRVLVYNITDETTTFIGDTLDGDYKWDGACVSKVDGCIYCAPSNHRQVLKINPVDASTTLIGEEYDEDLKWSGCVEAPDGTIYCSPSGASNFLKIDVRTGTTSLVGEVQQPRDGFGWEGCVSHIINGNMYIFIVPHNADRILMFDITNESVHEFGSEISGRYFQPAISSIDGNAYAIASNCSKSILKINLSLLQTIHQAIQVKGIPWPMLQSIAENNIHALEQGDPNTGLLPFMVIAVRRDGCKVGDSLDTESDNDEKEVDLPFMSCEYYEATAEADEAESLASLTLSYQLLSLKPAVMNHYV